MVGPPGPEAHPGAARLAGECLWGGCALWTQGAGLQDSSGSFDRLLPLLQEEQRSFLAIDLPGHGFSSRLPPGVYYDYPAYIFTLQHIAQHFQWPKLSLMGHSLGGIIAYSYTMFYPQQVDFVVSMDGIKPLVHKDRISLMAKNLQAFLRGNEHAMSAEEPPSYTLEEMKQRVHLSNWRSEEIVAQAHHITCPIFVSKSTEGGYYEKKEHFYQVMDVLKRSSAHYDFHYVEGTHHAHLNQPEGLAAPLREFLARRSPAEPQAGLNGARLVSESEDPRVSRNRLEQVLGG
ncbi:hypothetical protein HUJ04_000072 [Dendroctonus ponderosae]|nr:hypothetical protein HUJ04_000072 [Dendroctonus ponderosae]